MNAELTKLSTKNYLTYRRSLIIYSERFNLRKEDAEEMVNDSILKALDNFDNDRGSFEGFCKTILKNKILNFKKTKIHLFLLILIDENEKYLKVDDFTIEDKENNLVALNFISKLNETLTDDEARFLNEVYKSCDSSDKLSISEASKNIEITPLKGWDIFRKIQRKAEKLNLKLRFNYEYDDMDIEMELEIRISEIQFQKDENIIEYYKLNNFENNFTPEQIKKLNSIYNFQF